MRLVNLRAGWMSEGMFITILAANKPVDDKCMASYYGPYPGDKHYAQLQRPNKFTRVVLMKPTGKFVIVPLTPLVIQLPSDPSDNS